MPRPIRASFNLYASRHKLGVAQALSFVHVERYSKPGAEKASQFTTR